MLFGMMPSTALFSTFRDLKKIAKIKCREINMTRKLSNSYCVNNLKSEFITITHVYNNHFELSCGNVLVLFRHYCFPSPHQVALLYNPQTVYLLVSCQ